MKRTIIFFSLLLTMGLFSGCGDDDVSDVPEGWAKGPNGSFTLKVVSANSDFVGYFSMLEASIESTPDDLTATEKNFLYQGRKIEFNPTDIPGSDRKVGSTFNARITAYYQESDSYERVHIVCQIKKNN